MHPLVALLYEGTAKAARFGSRFASPAGGKTQRTFAARRGLTDRWTEWAARTRDPARALLWMHAPSVGEGLQARPVIERLRAALPETQIAYTFYSPSAEAFARALPVDGADYLPFDTTADARAMLDALRPRALVFSKLDVWPALTREAAARGVRLGLISATLAEGSARRSPLGRALLGDAYARLERIGAIDPRDADRLVALGARREAIRVTGDTRYDQVWVRAQNADRKGALLAPLYPRGRRWWRARRGRRTRRRCSPPGSPCAAAWRVRASSSRRMSHWPRTWSRWSDGRERAACARRGWGPPPHPAPMS